MSQPPLPTHRKTFVDVEDVGIFGTLITARKPGDVLPEILVGTSSYDEALDVAEEYIRKHRTSVKVSARLQESLDCR
jgi:hypothetical protein